MEEQFILRVPPSVAERIERLLNEEDSSSEDKSLDLSFSEDGRTGTFVIGNDCFTACLMDIPTVVESYKTYDDTNLIKTADIGQMIMVREAGDLAPEVVEYRHGLTPPMRDARKRRFRREPDLNNTAMCRGLVFLVKIVLPFFWSSWYRKLRMHGKEVIALAAPEFVRRVEKDLVNIMAGGTVENIDVEMAPQADDGRKNANKLGKRAAAAPPAKSVPLEPKNDAVDGERSDSDESEESD